MDIEFKLRIIIDTFYKGDMVMDPENPPVIFLFSVKSSIKLEILHLIWPLSLKND